MRWTAKARWWAVGGLVAAGGVLMALGGAPPVNNSLSVWFVEDDPARLAYERFQELFGNDEVTVLYVGARDGALTGAQREAVTRAAARMREVEGVASVTGPDDAGAGPLAELLLNRDGSAALLMARLDVMEDVDARRHDILVGLREAAAPLEASGVDLHWAGIGLVYDELNEASFRETPLLTGVSFVVVGAILYFVTGSLGAVASALGGVVVSIMILLGIFTLAGFELNMVTAILPTLLLVVGTATAVHVFTRLGRVREEAMDDALRDVFKPCLFTALTTAAGFASLMAARMAVIRDLGGFAALGVLISLVASFAFASAFLSAGWLKPGTDGPPGRRRAVEAFARWVTERPREILAVAAAVAALSVWSAGRVVVDTYSIEFFEPDHPVRVDSDAVEAGYGWYLPLEFSVTRAGEKGVLEPEFLASVSAWQDAVERAGLASWSLSVGDFLAPGRSPAPELAGSALVDDARSTLRVSFGVPMASARGWAERIDDIRGAAEGTLASDADLTPGGYLPLYVRMMDYIVDTQLRSFSLALILVFGVMGIFLRSARTVVLALFPNLLPIAMVFATMGALGIRLDIATVTVAAIALGIIVDDTVHLLFHYERSLRRQGDPARAVEAALVEVGPALVATTVILASSFAVLGFASVASIALFGLLSAATLLFALVSDVLVLPALLVLVGGPSPSWAEPAGSGAP